LPSLKVLGASGHIEMTWDCDDEEAVAQARAEFNRLREAGYLLFTVREERTEFDPADRRLEVTLVAAGPVVPATAPAPEAAEKPKRSGLRRIGTQTKQFDAKASTVAVPAFRGG